MSESRSELALSAALQSIEPLVELLLREGVSYPRFAGALKAAFLQAGEKILAADGARVNDSSLSTLTGVHRKDVRVWRSEGETPAPSKGLGPVTEVYARWVSDPDYCERQGNPKVLARNGTTGSFEALALSVTKDVHPYALLQEMVRLGVARRLDGDSGAERIELCVDAFVPKSGTSELLQLFSDNVGDHIAAAANNLQGHSPMLEQAVFADELTAESTEALGVLARRLWADLFREVVREATILNQRDAGQPGADRRVRLGMYYFHGTMNKP